MENDILDSLNDLGYEGPLTEEVAFAKALDGGPKSLEFTKLIHILAEELKKLCKLEETVNIINSPDESSSFLLELSSFLKELGCPYKCLVMGHMSSRLQSREDRLLLLDYLVSELMAARMVQVDCPKEAQATGMEIVMQESQTAKDLKDILITLKFNKPPPNITVELLFSKLEAKLKDTIQKEGDKLVGKPLYNKALTEKDWKNLETAFMEMYEEYRLRRETLITRLECTIQSFEWSDRLKSKKDTIQSVYRPTRAALTVKPNVKLSDFLAARTALLQVEKTASASVRRNTTSDVNKVLIGRVPDRGGRPNEQQPPPPEMPSWQQRSAPQVNTRRPERLLSSYFDELCSAQEKESSRTSIPSSSKESVKNNVQRNKRLSYKTFEINTNVEDGTNLDPNGEKSIPANKSAPAQGSEKKGEERNECLDDVIILEDKEFVTIEDSDESPRQSPTHDQNVEILPNICLKPKPKRKTIPEHSTPLKKLKAREETDYSSFGEHVADSLRNMDENMALVCQKIINDAISMAQVNSLSCDSRIVNDCETLSNSDVTSIQGGGGGRGGGRGGGDAGRGRGGDRGRGGGDRGRGGRVQGGYSQATGQEQARPHTSPAFNQSRNYQTYEVPPGGYNNYNQSNANGNYQQYDGRQDNRGYNQGFGADNSYQRQSSYDSSGSYNQTYTQGGGGGYKTYQQAGYQPNRGYHEQDDRRGRGGYRERR